METIPTKQGRPDIDAIMAQIRADVRKAVDEGEGRAPHYRSGMNSAASPSSEALIESPELQYLNKHWSDWSVVEELSSHRKLLGPIIVRIKRFVLEVVRKNLLRGYFERERQFQMHLVRHLNSAAKHTDSRDYDIFWQLTQRSENDTAGVNERMDRLFGDLLAECRTVERELRAEIELLRQQLASEKSVKRSAVG